MTCLRRWPTPGRARRPAPTPGSGYRWDGSIAERLDVLLAAMDEHGVLPVPEPLPV